MAITSTLNVSLSTPGVTAGSIPISTQASSELSLDWASAPTNLLKAFFIPTSGSLLQGLWIMSNVAAHLYTNAASTGSPTNSFTLTANVPIIWVPGSGTQPLQASPDVTSLYITSLLAAGHIDVYAFYNAS